MTPDDPADAIAHALARLRPRGPHGPHGPHGAHGRGRHHPERGASGFPRGGPARMRMLETLVAASEPLTVSALGEAIGVDQPRASRLVQQGVELGLVVREADPSDARRTRIALTEQGRTVARGIRGRRRRAVSEALEHFTEQERRELARLLAKLADHWAEPR